MPVWFLSHGGGPCFFMDGKGSPMFQDIDKNSECTKWYKQLAEQTKVPQPKAIVVLSAHWETEDTVFVTSQDKHASLFYDYYGFPKETYELKYPSPGSPALAKQIVSLLTEAGFTAEEDKERNLDHGVFIPLMLVFPKADIPVLQVSLLAGLDPKKHMLMGRALRPLREQGVLIIGSGQATHDLMGSLSGKSGIQKAHEFVAALTETVCKSKPEERTTKLLNWEKLPHARKTHGREEHLIPMHVAVGAAADDPGTQLGDYWAAQLMSLACYQFTAA
jgi:aromatic ring-opening dioxygenase catalytic subunit (LigB family)